MRLPSFAKPVLSRATPVARAHAGGVLPQDATVPYNPALGCSVAGAGWTPCGAAFANARFPGMQMLRCCDPSEMCANGQCVNRAIVATNNRVPAAVAQYIGSFV